jgi:hypothetical protein
VIATNTHSDLCCCRTLLPRRSFTSDAVQEAVDGGQLGLTGLRQLLLMYQQQLADISAIPHTV